MPEAVRGTSFSVISTLQIQEELVRAKKLIPDMEAGGHLQDSLNQLLKTLDNKKLTTTSLDPAQIASIHVQILSQWLSRFFDLGVGRILNGLRG